MSKTNGFCANLLFVYYKTAISYFRNLDLSIWTKIYKCFYQTFGLEVLVVQDGISGQELDGLDVTEDTFRFRSLSENKNENVNT